MGAVHGVHMKYVALSFTCATGAYRSSGDEASAIAFYLLCYAAAVHALISALFLLRRGVWILGKDAITGRVPLWSLVLFSAFHVPTWLYTYVHTLISKREGVPVASEVHPGWWIGGRYAAELGRRWAATIDLTVEFDEGCMATSQQYLLVACWDGQPPKPADIERAARFAVAAAPRGDVMVHCVRRTGSTCRPVARRRPGPAAAAA